MNLICNHCGRELGSLFGFKDEVSQKIICNNHKVCFNCGKYEDLKEEKLTSVGFDNWTSSTNWINKYGKTFNNGEEAMLEIKNIKDMKLSEIEEYIQELEIKANKKNKEEYDFENQRKEVSDFIEELSDEITNSYGYEDLCDEDGKAPDINFFIAGGAILSTFTKTEINDYDLYFYTEEDFKNFNNCINNCASKILETDRSITYVRSGQVFQLCKVFGTPQEIFNKFDFTVCMAALPCAIGENGLETKEFVFSETFLSDVMSKSLIFNEKTLYPLNSLVRLKKYLNKGYEINSVNMMKMALAVNILKIETVKDLKEQLIGISEEVSDTIRNYLSAYKDDYKIDNPLEFFIKITGVNTNSLQISQDDDLI